MLKFLEFIDYISKETFMPITIGGKIQELKDIEQRLILCADKVSINSKAIENENLFLMLLKNLDLNVLSYQ